MERLHFSKYVGCGNDFILIDDREGTFPFASKEWIAKLCHRNFGIGADGIILLQSPQKADFRMRIFNCDGSEAEMCGNGIRCLKLFLSDLGYKEPSYLIETMKRQLKVTTEEGLVAVEMGPPTELRFSIPIAYQGQEYEAYYLDTGVPHLVLFVDDIAAIDVAAFGSFLRHHPLFAPKGCNVNFAERTPFERIAIRTYERGVERETLACGTGATAAALAAAYKYQLKSPVNIGVSSKDQLSIGFQWDGALFSNVTMRGEAYRSFVGQYKI